MEHNYILGDFYGNSQADLERALAQFSQLRDYHRSLPNWDVNWTFMIFYNLMNFAALAANFTLIARGHPDYKVEVEPGGKYPRMFPILKMFDHNNLTVIDLWRKFKRHGANFSGELPEFVRTQDLDWNFLYCAVEKRKQVSLWNFSLFTDSFDFLIWLCIASSLVFVSIFSFRKIFPSFVLFSSLSVLITPGISGLQKKWGNSLLFVLWMHVCLILYTFYSGLMSSQIISPSPEDTLSNLEDLNSHDYTIAGSGSRGWIAELNSTPYRLFGKVSTLRRIYKKHPLLHLNTSEMILELTGEKKVAAIRVWLYAIGTVNSINDIIAAGGIPGGENKKCYVGKELIPAGEFHLAVLPPGNKKIVKVAQKLFASGIWIRWAQEIVSLISSQRVQDRVKIISPTKLLDEKMAGTLEPLKLEGKSATIFLLLTICLLISGKFFVLELLLFHVLS